MNETRTPTSVPVTYKPMPNGEGGGETLTERRQYAIALAKAAAEIKRLTDLNYKDDATGLFNRRFYEEQVPRLIAEAVASGETLALMIVDIDGLKRLNKQEGLDKGDELIQAGGSAAQQIARTDEEIDTYYESAEKEMGGLVRPDDIVCRYGGDEFILLLPGYKPQEGQSLKQLNDSRIGRAKKQFEESSTAANIPDDLHVGISVGIAVLNPGDFEPGTEPKIIQTALFKSAETKLLEAKDEKYAELQKEGIFFYDERLLDHLPPSESES